MKKSAIIIGMFLATLSLMAFGWVKWSQADNPGSMNFFYDVDSRSGTSISKEKLHNTKSVVDIVPKEADWGRFPIQSVKVTIYHDSTETSIIGDNVLLNEAQVQLLKSIDYSDSFSFTASCKGRHKNIPDREEYDLFYILTVTPEKEAEYIMGKNMLIEYLKENSKAETAIAKQADLKRGQISFTVSAEGDITDLQLSETSGYPTIDNKMIQLIKTMPGKWESAENSHGEKIAQEFVYSFGRGGC